MKCILWKNEVTQSYYSYIVINQIWKRLWIANHNQVKYQKLCQSVANILRKWESNKKCTNFFLHSGIKNANVQRRKRYYVFGMSNKYHSDILLICLVSFWVFYSCSIAKNWLDTLDDVLWINFSETILNEAFRSPDHKTFF